PRRCSTAPGPPAAPPTPSWSWPTPGGCPWPAHRPTPYSRPGWSTTCPTPAPGCGNSAGAPGPAAGSSCPTPPRAPPRPPDRAALAARQGRALDPGEPPAAAALERLTSASGWRLTAYDDAEGRFLAIAARLAT